MRVLFLRHAHSVSQHDKTVVVGRAHDAALSERGRVQAAALAEALAAWPIDAVYTSTCVRAYETARPIAERLELPLEETDDLVERSQGDLEGVPKDAAYPPDIERRMHADQWRWKPPNGESLEEVAARLGSFFRDVEALPPTATCLAVSHQMVAWSLFYLCTRCDHAILPTMRLDNGAIVEVALEPGRAPRLVRWNWPLLGSE